MRESTDGDDPRTSPVDTEMIRQASPRRSLDQSEGEERRKKRSERRRKRLVLSSSLVFSAFPTDLFGSFLGKEEGIVGVEYGSVGEIWDH